MRRDLLFGVIAVAAAATCVRLGVWQLDRLAERRAHNAAVRAARARPPLELAGALPPIPADSARDRRLTARGRYDFDHERLGRARSYEGVPGVSLITPLRLADGSAVLVDRGWVPSPDAARVGPLAYRGGESVAVEVEGLGVVAPRGRGDVDPRTLADSLPYPLLPFVLQVLPPDRPSARPPELPRRWPAPRLGDGPHLSYAIQWFSFAVIIVAGSIALYRRRPR